jgi:hypothetical protein
MVASARPSSTRPRGSRKECITVLVELDRSSGKAVQLHSRSRQTSLVYILHARTDGMLTRIVASVSPRNPVPAKYKAIHNFVRQVDKSI